MHQPKQSELQREPGWPLQIQHPNISLCKLMKSPCALAPSQKKSETNAISVARCSASPCLQRPKAVLHKASGSLPKRKELQCDGQTTARVLILPVVSSSLCSQGCRCDQLCLTRCGHPSQVQPVSVVCPWPAPHRPRPERQHS